MTSNGFGLNAGALFELRIESRAFGERVTVVG